MVRGKQPNNPYRSTTKNALRALGEDESTASILAVLVDKGEATAKGLQRETGYSYVTVQNALRRLRDRDWIDSDSKTNDRRGRNPLVYTVSVTKTRVTSYYKDIWRFRLDEVMRALF